jgi:transposase-like protein
MPAAKKSKTTTRTSASKAKLRKRYTPAERGKIMAEAKAAGLTGKQVAEKYGVSAVTFYLWRKKVGNGRSRSAGRNGTLASVTEAKLRAAVRAKMAGMLPKILNEEVDRVLGR